jgi:hypothetical protein
MQRTRNCASVQMVTSCRDTLQRVRRKSLQTAYSPSLYTERGLGGEGSSLESAPPSPRWE